MTPHESHEIITTREDYGSRVVKRYCVACEHHDLATLAKPCEATT